jgi:hypothetical protein
LYFQAFVGIYVGIVILVIPFSPNKNYTDHEALVYASSWSLQRGMRYITLSENCNLTLFVEQTHRLH